MSSLAEQLTQHGMDASSLRVFATMDVGDIYVLQAPGADAITLWTRLWDLVGETGYWPVVLGEDESVEMHLENLADFEDDAEHSTASLIQAGVQLDAEAWLRARQGELGDDIRLEGPWPERVRPHNSFSIPCDILTRKPFPSVTLALVPTRTCWEVPAILRYGGWNACPAPEEHVALMKRWHERYGAEVVGMSHDVVEMQVARPPTDPAGALALAWEQYFYCDDIVSQGTETVQNLAAGLLNGRVWYFWWD